MAVRLQKIRPHELGEYEKKLARKVPQVVEKLHRRASRKAVEILRAEVLAVQPYPPVFRRRYLAGWSVQRLKYHGVVIDNRAMHAIYVEGGRRAGAKMPPPKALVPWVRKRFGLSGKKALSAAYALAVKISRDGIKAKRVSKRARPKILRAFRAELKSAAREWLRV